MRYPKFQNNRVLLFLGWVGGPKGYVVTANLHSWWLVTITFENMRGQICDLVEITYRYCLPKEMSPHLNQKTTIALTHTRSASLYD